MDDSYLIQPSYCWASQKLWLVGVVVGWPLSVKEGSRFGSLALEEQTVQTQTAIFSPLLLA
jgi:hypothetical protein